MKNEIKICAIVILISLAFIPLSVFAFSMTAGPVMILVDVGGSNSSSYGLMNSGNESITLAIRAEGNAAQFLEVPNSLELVPNKLTYVDIKATIPSTYDGSLGGNITGFIYAMQQGAPGQVQINVQAQKLVEILIPQYGGKLPEERASMQPTATQPTTQQPNTATGFASLIGTNPLYLGVIIAVVLIASIFFIFKKRFEISIKPKTKQEVNK